MIPSDLEKPQRLADRLLAIQHQRFVGRVAELELFRSALLDSEPQFAILHLYGPGGIGKTTLLTEYIWLAREAGVFTIYIDGRNIEPSPPGFLRALSIMLPEQADPMEFFAQNQHVVLLIDTYENLFPLDGWLRDTLLPQLPGTSLTVISGRNPPDAKWRTSPGWRDLTRIVALRNLHPEESLKYLHTRGITQTQRAKVLEFTHGHPLALSLVADTLNQNADEVDFDPKNNPDVVRVLLNHFLHNMPSVEHRHALEVCAHMRVTSESLLAAFFGAEKGHELFAWLYELSFIEHSAEGIFPHDVVREVLDTDLRWRDPERFREMSHQVRTYLMHRIQHTQGIEQQQAMYSHFFLHRNNKMWQIYHSKEMLGHTYAEPPTPDDFPVILDMVLRHEGQESMQIAHYWLEKQPAAFAIFRRIDGEIVGFMANLHFYQLSDEDMEIDPAVRSVFGFVEQYGPLRSGEVLFLHRFWMGKDQYQTIPIQAVVELAVGVHLLTNPKLAWNFPCVADPDFWQPNFAYLNWHRTTEADFEVAGRRYGVFSHDWRTEPLPMWLETMLGREMASDFKPEEFVAMTATPLIVLSQTEFEEAVKQALRDYPHADLLVNNPLMRSRLIIQKNGENAPPIALQSLLIEAADNLNSTPKTEKFYHALYHTYLKPAPTQEAAAEMLDLPFSTYRRYLTNAVTHITEWLWKRELYGYE